MQLGSTAWGKGKTTYLALGQLGLDGGPGLGLGGVGEKVHDDGTAGDGLIDIEEVLSGDPAVLHSILPRLAILADTDDDVEAVVAQVETLAVALGAVADEGKSVVLEVVLKGIGQFILLQHTWGCVRFFDSQGASPGASRHALKNIAVSYTHARTSHQQMLAGWIFLP